MKKILPLLLLSLTACSDWDDEGTETIPTVSAPQPAEAISFTASVAPSQTAVETRSDGSIINRRETIFPPTGTTYYQYLGGEVKQMKLDYRIGLFAAYTGTAGWTPASTANFMYNQPMTIAPPSGTPQTNLLNYYSHQTGQDTQAAGGTYTPTDSLVRFWPGKVDGTGSYGRLSFWAYYPYNPTVSTGAPGQYGIHINTSATGVAAGSGMGQVQFTMSPDASEQSDFMLSELMPDCDKTLYPLTGTDLEGYSPSPVPLRFHHMLAQVRLYAFIRGTDKMVYQQTTRDEQTIDLPADEAWLASLADGTTSITDPYGNRYDIVKANGAVSNITAATKGGTLTVEEFKALGLKVPDEAQCVRWERRTGVWDVTRSRQRGAFDYEMSFNNIYTSCIFTPTYADGKTTYPYSEAGTLGSATVSHYVMNPYWFRFRPLDDTDRPAERGERVMLNENYMYDFFEDAPGYRAGTMSDGEAAEALAQDGIDWKTLFGTGESNALGYKLTNENLDTRESKHYNYAPGNIILAVPQKLDDDNAPNICVTAKGYQERNGRQVYTLADGTTKIMVKRDGDGNITATYNWDGTDRLSTEIPTGAVRTALTARVTVNMLQMDIKWESGFIYNYAFIDDLQPGDDKVRGPETITVVFDPSRITDQW